MAGGSLDWGELKNLLKKLNKNIEDFNKKSSCYSKILVALTVVLAILAIIQVYLLVKK